MMTADPIGAGGNGRSRDCRSLRACSSDMTFDFSMTFPCSCASRSGAIRPCRLYLGESLIA
jgi:hypothetical protein